MTDWSSGLAPEKDLVFPGRPDDPAMRESVSVWLIDDAGEWAFPRGGIEAEAASWDERRVQANFAFADGRVLNGAGMGSAHPAMDEEGRPTVLGAGPLRFRCVEPFRRWTMRYDGPVQAGTVAQQIGGGFGSAGEVPVRLEAELTMAAPAWVQETGDTEGMTAVEAANAAAMGLGYRFEQLFRATGTLTLDGHTRPFHGTGLRIHRQSVRSLAGFAGHCWQSALFPDGSGFHSLVYPPLPGDDAYSHNDAVILRDGRLYPARVVRAPMLRRIVAAGDDATVELESEFGRTVIEGTTLLSTFRVGNPDMGGLNLQQAAVRYRWGDREAYGMIERSSHASLTTVG